MAAAAGSGNFTFKAPVARYPGRGQLQLELNLVYNSRVWQKFSAPTPTMVFDIDHGWPVTGWTLGMGTLVGLAGRMVMVVEPDGTRHPFKFDRSEQAGTGFPRNGLKTFFHTVDGSGIYYEANWTILGPGQYRLESGVMLRPDGTRTDYEIIPSTKLVVATRITDANGNEIVVSYDVNGYLKSITDTCGRVVRCNYRETAAGNLLLESISGPASDVAWNSGAAQPNTGLILLNYARLPVVTSFVDPVYEPWGTVEVISALYYPATQTGYWFPADAYSSYGQLRRVQACRAMTLKPSDNVVRLPVIGVGPTSWQREYNYPDAGLNLADVPTYTTLIETWAGQTGGPVVTRFESSKMPDADRTSITWPDGSKTHRDTTLEPGTPDQPAGLLKLLGHNAPDGTGLKWTKISWVVSADWTPQPSEVLDFFGDGGTPAKTVFSYGPSSNLPTRVDQWCHWFHVNQAPTLLRVTETDYLDDAAYRARNLRNLPASVRTYDPSNAWAAEIPKLASRTDFEYDQTPLAPAPGITGISPGWVPGSPTYDPSTAARGNPTTIRRHTDPETGEAPATEVRGYDVAGNLRTSDIGVGRIQYDFAAESRYSAPGTVWLTANPPGARRMALRTIRYNWDGQPGTVTYADGNQVSYGYDAAGRVRSALSASTQSEVLVARDDAALTATTSTRRGLSTQDAYREVTSLDGLQRPTDVRTIRGDGDTIVSFRHDNRGRVAGVTAPYRDGGQPQWATAIYDPIGRIVSATNLGGGVSRYFYDEATRPTNHLTVPDQQFRTIRIVDPAGTERWLCLDALGQVLQVVSPDPEGPGTVLPQGAVSTTYRYDGNGNVTNIDLHAVGLPTQSRRFRHDGLSRLVRAYLPEQGDGIRETRAGADERWSLQLDYDERSNLVSRRDSRGVRTLFDFRSDPFDRVFTVSYDMTSVNDPSHPIVNCPDVVYEYQTEGDLRHIAKEICSGVSTEEIIRIPQHGPTSSMVTMAAAPDRPFRIDHGYDGLSRLILVIYPAMYGDPGSPRPECWLTYQTPGGRLTSMAPGPSGGEGLAYDIESYAPSGQASDRTIGTGGVHETDGFAADPALLMSRQVKDAGGFLLDLRYNYTPAGGGSKPAPSEQVRQITDNLDPSGTRQVAYDRLGRIKDYAGAGNAWGETYAFDLHGNRTQVSPRGEIAPSDITPADGEEQLAYDDANRITGAGFDYDAAGNVAAARIAGVDYRFQYDAAGRLVYVNNVQNGLTTGYIYGACNRRRGTVALNANTSWPPSGSPSQLAWPSVESVVYYSWDNDKVVAAYEGTGPDLNASLRWKELTFFLGPRLLGTWQRLGNDLKQARFYHPGLTGTRLVTWPAQNGQLAGHAPHEPMPYGAAFISNAEGSRPFASYQRDARTGLDYAVNRFYSPMLGRFLQPDPLGAAAFRQQDSQSLNGYTYCRNDPLNLTDPLGLIQGGEHCEDLGNGFYDCDGERVLAAAPVTVWGTVFNNYVDPDGAARGVSRRESGEHPPGRGAGGNLDVDETPRKKAMPQPQAVTFPPDVGCQSNYIQVIAGQAAVLGGVVGGIAGGIAGAMAGLPTGPGLFLVAGAAAWEGAWSGASAGLTLGAVAGTIWGQINCPDAVIAGFPR